MSIVRLQTAAPDPHRRVRRLAHELVDAVLDIIATPRAGVTTAASDVMTAVEVAQLIRTDRSWVYRHKRKLGGQTFGGVLRFSRRTVEAYIERRQVLG